jgi:hypothetical protein
MKNEKRENDNKNETDDKNFTEAQDVEAITDFPGQCTPQVNARSLTKTSTPLPHIQLDISQPVLVQLG